MGDVELWFMEGSDWKLPFFVEWRTPDDNTGRIYGVLRPALCFYPNQLLTVQNLLGAHAMEDRNDRWILNKPSVHSMLVKAPGITPQFYYQWPADSHPPITAPPAILSLDGKRPLPGRRAQQFKRLSDYIARCRGLPADTVMVVLTALSQLGTQWMVSCQEPLDLGFVRLVALPYRTNWKDIVAFKCKPNKLPKLLRLNLSVRKQALSTIGFEEVVTSPHNVGLAGQVETRLRRLHYTIEAIPSQQFESEVDHIEKNRMLSGHSSYVAFYEQTVEKFYDDIVATMDNYLRKATSPWAAVRPLVDTGLVAFLPISRHRVQLRGIPIAELPQHLASPDTSFSSVGDKQSDPILIQAQAAQVRKMPPLLPAPPDVRERQEPGHMGQLRPKGTVRLPVLDASQGAGPGQPVLPCDSTPARES